MEIRFILPSAKSTTFRPLVSCFLQKSYHNRATAGQKHHIAQIATGLLYIPLSFYFCQLNLLEQKADTK